MAPARPPSSEPLPACGPQALAQSPGEPPVLLLHLTSPLPEPHRSQPPVRSFSQRQVALCSRPEALNRSLIALRRGEFDFRGSEFDCYSGAAAGMARRSQLTARGATSSLSRSGHTWSWGRCESSCSTPPGHQGWRTCESHCPKQLAQHSSLILEACVDAYKSLSKASAWPMKPTISRAGPSRIAMS